MCLHPEDCGETYLCGIYLCKCYAYSAQGPAAAADLLQGIEGEYLGNEQTPQNNKYEVHALLCFTGTVFIQLSPMRFSEVEKNRSVG